MKIYSGVKHIVLLFLVMFENLPALLLCNMLGRPVTQNMDNKLCALAIKYLLARGVELASFMS